MRRSIFAVIVAIVLCLSVFATDDQIVSVTSSSVLKDKVLVKANLQGKHTELVCDATVLSCSAPPPGEYRMKRAADADAIHQDCTDVVLSRFSGDRKEKVGVYCWLGSEDCYISPCSPAQVETFPAMPLKHSWDVFMNTPEAKAAAAKLAGHCGDAETQDVMNACFAGEFQNVNQQMDSIFEAALKQLSEKDKASARLAQKAWLRYRALHCEAVGAIHVGGGSLEPTEINTCKTGLTKARTKEIKDSYGVPEQ